MTFGAEMKRLRDKHGLTQVQFAEYVGADQRDVSRWEQRATEPTVFQRAFLIALETEGMDYLERIKSRCYNLSKSAKRE